MASIKEWLDEAGFDWATGRIIVHEIGEGTISSSPGWTSARDVARRREADADDPVVTQEFDDGYGGPQCPRFIAEDEGRIYFPWQYDGATGIDWVCKDLGHYLLDGTETPYPGG